MKRRTMALFLAAALVISLAACGRTQAPAAEGAAENAAETQTEDAAFSPEAGDAAQESATGETEAAAAGDGQLRFAVTQKRMETEEVYTGNEYIQPGDPFPWGYVSYPEFEMPEETKQDFPKLADALAALTNDYYDRALQTLAEEANMVEEWFSYGEVPTMYTSNEQNWMPQVKRADERIVSMLVLEESFYNGAHPFTDYASLAFDTQTGEGLPLSDVVNDLYELPEILLNNLKPLDEDYVFSEQEKAEILPKIEAMVAEGMLPWTLDDEGFHAYFDAYDLMFYAFGPIFVDLSYKSWPNLIRETYLPPEPSTQSEPLSARITYAAEEEPAEKWTAEVLARYYVPEEYEEEYDGDAPSYWVECPDWDAVLYNGEGVTDPIGESLITLTEVVEERESTDWLDQDAWSARTGIALPPSTYGVGTASVVGPTGSTWDDDYNYTVYNYPEDHDLRLHVQEAYGGAVIGNYDFSSFLDTPAPGNEFTEFEIPCAKFFDGTLYVEIAHRTYAADQPYTGYIVAVEADTGRVLWRSETLRANAHNFVIIDDQIICGYGFTNEDDYLYILSRHDGAVLDHWKLKTGPDYFLPVSEPGREFLWVLTYNTAYKYQISYG